MELTHKEESKELETALEVVRCLIAIAKNSIKSEPEESRWQNELHQLYEVENLLEEAEEFYYE
tara:strand:+ start:1560 stop:1748 length:189 start_codon:yes stop_codon:yes gene_type:complete